MFLIPNLLPLRFALAREIGQTGMLAKQILAQRIGRTPQRNAALAQGSFQWHV